MDEETFLARYPQFRQAGALVSLCLKDAALKVEPSIYLKETEYAIGLFAAQMLARSPYGQSMRLEDDDTKTIFDVEIEELKTRCLPRMIVV